MSDKEIIHIGKMGGSYSFLKRVAPHCFAWFDESGQELKLSGYTIEEAIRKAHSEWSEKGFQTVICGFRYTLPERDEHGLNALFFQMVRSLETPNGIYFDEELGSNCYVQNISLEAKGLWQKMKAKRPHSSREFPH